MEENSHLDLHFFNQQNRIKYRSITTEKGGSLYAFQLLDYMYAFLDDINYELYCYCEIHFNVFMYVFLIKETVNTLKIIFI